MKKGGRKVSIGATSRWAPLSRVGVVLGSMRLLDWMALFLAAISVASISFAVYSSGAADGPPSVSIQATEGHFEYPLGQDRMVTFIGPIGKTVVQIQEKRVRVLSDPGPKQICVEQGAISSPGDWLACLPNHVFIKITGRPPASAVDAKTY